LPVTALGELHQSCLADRDAAGPLAGQGGQRRARGVHYTPLALVDYLTAGVLDRVLAGHGEQAPVRILDPSCGGGTFLLAALGRLLTAKAGALRPGEAGLSTQDGLDLLGASLFGVDVDPQAVEWTRRALLLAVWDAALASKAPAPADNRLRVPSLRRNVVCRDFLACREAAAEGPTGGFDAVLGGPPFVRLHSMLRTDPAGVERYRAEYPTARSGQFDLSMPFFEEAIRQLRPGGWLGWSVSNTFLRNASGRPLRSLLAGNCTVHELVEFEDRKLYPDAVTQIALVLLERGRREAPCRHAWVAGTGGLRDKLGSLRSGPQCEHPAITVRRLPAEACRCGDWSLASDRERGLLDRLRAAGIPLGRLPVSVCRGLVTGADGVYLLRRVARGEGETLVQGRERGRHHLLESALLRPVVRSRDIHGYGRLAPRSLCIVPHDERGRPIPEQVLRSAYPRTYRYLLARRDTLLGRAARPAAWYALRSATSLRLPPGPRLLLGQVCSGGNFTLDPAGLLQGHAGVLLLVPDEAQLDPFYLLGVLNSRVFWFFVRQTMPTMGEGRHALRRSALRGFPVVASRAAGPDDRRRRIAELVRGLFASKDAPSTRPRVLEEIERLVAELYAVAPEDLGGHE
jgi:hypothetical protein